MGHAATSHLYFIFRFDFLVYLTFVSAMNLRKKLTSPSHQRVTLALFASNLKLMENADFSQF